MAVEEIVSGGQTGADRAAWDVAIELGLKHGGWVPAGKKAENDETIPERYANLKEAASPDCKVRTEYNVLDSDATLIVSHGELSGGSKHTYDFAVTAGKRPKHIELTSYSGMGEAIAAAGAWLAMNQPRKLNVAGPRASEDDHIYSSTMVLLTGILLGQNRAVQSNGLDAVKHLRESTISWLQHWDTIRWQVPYWFCTLATVAAGSLELFADKEKLIDSTWWVAGTQLFGCFGLCSLVLLRNLMLYDRYARTHFSRAASEFSIDPKLRVISGILLPYEYGRRGIRHTATLYFGIFILVLTLLSFAAVVMFSRSVILRVLFPGFDVMISGLLYWGWRHPPRLPV
jgi:Circularly permutated YpsA SLOG family